MADQFYSLSPRDPSMQWAYLDLKHNRVVGRLVGDIMHGGGIQSYAVSPAFAQAIESIDGYHLRPITPRRPNGSHLDWYVLDVEHTLTDNHYEHALPEDLVPDDRGIFPGPGCYMLRGYRPAPAGADTPDIFHNANDGATWVTQKVHDLLTAAPLKNVRLEPSEDFNPSWWDEDLAALRTQLERNRQGLPLPPGQHFPPRADDPDD